VLQVHERSSLVPREKLSFLAEDQHQPAKGLMFQQLVGKRKDGTLARINIRFPRCIGDPREGESDEETDDESGEDAAQDEMEEDDDTA
jgi:hypothetical protein